MCAWVNNTFVQKHHPVKGSCEASLAYLEPITTCLHLRIVEGFQEANAHVS